MNKREKVLSYCIGGLVVVLGINYIFSSFTSALSTRTTRVNNLRDSVGDQQFKVDYGDTVLAQMEDYRQRSLPSNPEAAQSEYKAWLEGMINESRMDDWSVDYVGNQGSNQLFQVYTFRITATGNIRDVGEVLRDFHAKNYLQRTKKLVLRQYGDDDNMLLMNLDVEAMALNDAAKDQPAPEVIDPRIGESAEEYLTSIINRNMFSPPNRAPSYSGNKTLTAYLDRDFATKLSFRDADGDRVEYEVVGDLPAGFKLSRGEIIGRPKEKGEYDFTVKAWDYGLPSREIEQQLSLNVTDAPEEKKAEPPPKFDDSRQAVLTGFVQSKGAWSVWINVRTKGHTLKLKEGDAFEVGSIAGKFIEVTDRYAVFESEGETYTIQIDSSLADAKYEAAL